MVQSIDIQHSNRLNVNKIVGKFKVMFNLIKKWKSMADEWHIKTPKQK